MALHVGHLFRSHEGLTMGRVLSWAKQVPECSQEWDIDRPYTGEGRERQPTSTLTARSPQQLRLFSLQKPPEETCWRVQVQSCFISLSLYASSYATPSHPFVDAFRFDA